jgi:type I restriction enzyme S subunit
MKKWKKISEYLFFQEGPGVRNYQYTSNGVKLLNVANLVNGKVDLTTSERYISDEEAYGKYKHFLADEGDLIIASSGIKVDYFDKKMGFIEKEHLPICMNTSTIRFKSLDNSKLDIIYFMYYLKSQSFKNQLSKQITGSAQLNFGPSHLKKMEFPIADLEEQRLINLTLSNVESQIRLKEKQLSEYDQLIKSRFVEMFGKIENKVKLETIAKIGSSHRIFTGEFVESGVPFYRGTEVGMLSQGVTDFKPYFISEERYLQIASDYTKPEIGDILMPSICDKGQLWIVNTNKPFYYKDGRVLSIRPDRNLIIPEYLHYYLKIKLTEIYKQITTGATFGEFKIFILKDVDIILPALDLQKRFTKFVQQVDKLKFVVQQSLDETQKLFDSLMQKYFG